MTDRRIQLICCNACWVFMTLFTLGWVVLAGFLPPPSPNWSAARTAQEFRDNTTGIRVGMIVSILSCAFMLPWGGAVAVQIRRVDRSGVLTWTWIAAMALLILEFMYPCAFWAVAAFRTADPARIQAFNDLGWLPFFGIISTGALQMALLATVTFLDKQSIYPRWFGYLNLWCIVGVAPAEFVLIAKTGPLAWNGILSYWVGLITAFVWVIAITVMTARAIKAAPDEPTLTERVAALEGGRVA